MWNIVKHYITIVTLIYKTKSSNSILQNQ